MNGVVRKSHSGDDPMSPLLSRRHALCSGALTGLLLIASLPVLWFTFGPRLRERWALRDLERFRPGVSYRSGKVVGLEFAYMPIYGPFAGRLTNRDLRSLKAFEHLEDLNIRENKGITDEGMDMLATFPCLKRLGVGGCGIHDAGVAALGRIVGLVELDVGATQITDAAIHRLRDLSQLGAEKVSGTVVHRAVGIPGTHN
jgi:hypothetical protein